MMQVSEELMNRMIEAFGQGWREADVVPGNRVGTRRRAGLKAALALIDPAPSPAAGLEVRVGDALVVAYAERITPAQRNIIVRASEEALPTDSTMLLLDGVSQIGVIRGG